MGDTLCSKYETQIDISPRPCIIDSGFPQRPGKKEARGWGGVIQQFQSSADLMTSEKHQGDRTRCRASSNRIIVAFMCTP